MKISVAAKTPATLEATMDRRKSKGVAGTRLWLNVRHGTLVIEGWPALLLAGALVAARLVLGAVGDALVPLGPEAHLDPGGASTARHERTYPALAPEDRDSGTIGIRGSRRAP